MILERMNRALINIYVRYMDATLLHFSPLTSSSSGDAGWLPRSCDPSLTSLSLSLSGSGFNARPGNMLSSSMPVYLMSSN